MLGLFKKKQPPVAPPVPPPTPPPLPGGEPFWDEMGMCRLIPGYLQLHLASQCPHHTLSRRPDGSIDTDAIPPLIQTDPQIRDRIARMVREQLPNNPAALAALTPEEIVSRLGNIYTSVTGKEMYGIVCKKWCVEQKLIG